MNNKINILENKRNEIKEIFNLLRKEKNNIELSIIKNENIKDWKDLQHKRDLIVEIEKKMDDLLKADEKLFYEIQEEESRAIESDEINIIDAIKYYIKEDIENTQIKAYIYKASKENKKIRYSNTTECNIELKKGDFNNIGLCVKKGVIREHNKKHYIQNIAEIIDRIHYNRIQATKYESEFSSYEYKLLYDYEKKALKELKLYCSILQAVYKIKF